MSIHGPARNHAGRRFSVLALPVALLLTGLAYGWGLNWAGLLGPDEPRYAAIGREMAASGDWVTPRLWGEVWLEKPALLYWMIGVGHRVGLTQEWAARGPVALASILFLGFFQFALGRLGTKRGAWYGTILLASSAGWIAFSEVAATDLPLAASFNAGVLSLLMAREKKWGAGYWAAGLFFGLALLAKGLVPVVLAAPLLWFYSREWRGWLKVCAVAGAVAAVWYGPMFGLHGAAFWNDFFVKHHFGRFASESLQHVQPLWFYVPVLAGWLYPWPMVAGLALWKAKAEYEWERVLLWMAAFGFVFFSASTNKLPGYVLPLVPMLLAVAGSRLERLEQSRRVWFWTGFALFLIPVAATILPEALLYGVRRVEWTAVPWEYFACSAAVGLVVQWMEQRGRRLEAVALLGLVVLAGILYVKLSAFPVLDEVVSARGLARKVLAPGTQPCVESLHRSLRYGLNYYVQPVLPDCEAQESAVRIVQPKGGLPRLEGAR